jgi:hypothetical protein
MGAEGLEHPTKMLAKTAVLRIGGAKSGAVDVGSQAAPRPTEGLAAALAMIASLPLTQEEKAEAVRRLLGQLRTLD